MAPNQPKILTHDKSAHTDDLLACAFLAHKTGLPIERVSQPTEDDLKNPKIWVVDFGRRFEPELKNFDHHQITGGSVCAFTQVLEHFKMRDYDALPWISFIETHDHNGPVEAMRLVGGGSWDMIFNPIMETVRQQFSDAATILPESAFYEQLRAIGKTIERQYVAYHRDLSEVRSFAKVYESHGFRIVDYRACNSFESTIALKNFEKDHDIDIILNVNYRSDAPFRMIRRNSNVSFLAAKDDPNVSFVHQSGFLVCFQGEPEEILKQLA